MTNYSYGSSLYPTEHERDLAAVTDWLTAAGLNPIDRLPATEAEAFAAADEYCRDVAARQWDDSTLRLSERFSMAGLAALMLEAARVRRAEV